MQLLHIDHLQRTQSAAGLMDPDHAFQLCRMIYAKGTVTKRDVDILFKFDRVCTRKHESFAALCVEALTNYFVRQTEQRSYVGDELGRVLFDSVAADGGVDALMKKAIA